jgi:hypothetical protein
MMDLHISAVSAVFTYFRIDPVDYFRPFPAEIESFNNVMPLVIRRWTPIDVLGFDEIDGPSTLEVGHCETFFTVLVYLSVSVEYFASRAICAYSQEYVPDSQMQRGGGIPSADGSSALT